MSDLDVALIVVLLLCTLPGLAVGAVAGLGGVLGALAGALAAVVLLPPVGDLLGGQALRAPILVALALALVVVCCAVGTGLGVRLGRPWREHPLRWLDRLAGAVMTAALGALVLSFVGSALATAGIPRVSPAFATSEVLRRIEEGTPDPVARALARAGTALRDDALPSVGGVLWDDGRAPMISVSATPTPLPVDDPEVARAAGSVGRVVASSTRCALGATGSGFVVGEDLLMTNAHVVAGADGIVVELPGRPAADADVVHLDTAMDAAVLRLGGDVAGQGGAPALPVGPDLAAGISAFVSGYPHGGPGVTRPAGVLGVGAVLFPEAGATDPTQAPRRESYRLATEVVPGNSGGPVIAPDGSVAGMVFARDDGDEGVAWAVTSDEVAGVLAAVPADPAPVDTGTCAR